MKKKYIVLLTDEERPIGDATIDTLKGSGQKAYRARILCPVAADGRTGSTTDRCKSRVRGIGFPARPARCSSAKLFMLISQV